MGTNGNIELIIGQERMIQGVSHDGYMAYEIIPRFVKYLEQEADKQISLKDWFYQQAKELLREPEEVRFVGRPCEVSIDTNNNIVTYNNNDFYFDSVSRQISEDFEPRFDKALAELKHSGYQVIVVNNGQINMF